MRLLEDDLILVTSNVIGVWRIPMLLPAPITSAGNIHRPLVLTPNPVSDAVVSSAPLRSSAKLPTDPPILLDFFGSRGGPNFLVRMVLKPVQSDDLLPHVIPVTAHLISVGGKPVAYESIRYDKNRALIIYQDVSHSVWASLSPFPTRNHQPGPATSICRRLYSPPAVGLPGSPMHSFCPASARLCVIAGDHEIRVMDYVIPPTYTS